MTVKYDAELTTRQANAIGARYGISYAGFRRVHMLFDATGRPVLDASGHPVADGSRAIFGPSVVHHDPVRLRKGDYSVSSRGIRVHDR